VCREVTRVDRYIWGIKVSIIKCNLCKPVSPPLKKPRIVLAMIDIADATETNLKRAAAASRRVVSTPLERIVLEDRWSAAQEFGGALGYFPAEAVP
jgi:hypothetical protein